MSRELSVEDERSERRKGARHVPVLQLASVETGGRVQLAVVLDLSAKGLSIRLATSALPGQPITICLREFVMEGSIAWLKEGKVGVTLYDELPPEVLEGFLSAFQPRMRAPRLSTDIIVKVRLSAASHRVALQNISPSGAMLALALAGPPATSRQIVVGLPHIGSVPGQVRWSDGARIGVLFNRALHLKDLSTVLDAGRAWVPQFSRSNRT